MKSAIPNSSRALFPQLPPGAGTARPRNSLRTPKSWLLTLSVATLCVLCIFAATAAEPQFSDLPPKSALQTNTPSKSNPSALPSSTTTNSAPQSSGPMDSLDQDHVLAIGDRLSFRIIEDEEDPKPLVVTDSGDLEVPYIGRYPAAGKTCRDLARALKTELEKEYYNQATVVMAVDIMAKSRGKIYIVGPVRAPGPLEIPSDEVLTLSKAILRAGGFTDFADKKNVRVTRKSANGGEQTFKVNVATILDKGKTETDLKLEAGDLIVVPERTIRF